MYGLLAGAQTLLQFTRQRADGNVELILCIA
jgi:hypothetical protein